MPYITREDGEHFVIPSYRDVLTAKSATAIQKDIMALSQSYGEYITMQRKAQLQFEVAFSPDVGYLLGETAWYQFNRPTDMIYCEAIPNSTEAILVIVKNGSVYLDGSFQVDSIPEELVIFLTQQNNFEIFTHGDVPISATSTEGKFSFDESSVKSFTVLDKPVFNSLPLINAYHLQPVDVTLKSQGIGGLPVKLVLMGIGALIALWCGYSYILAPMMAEKVQEEIPMEVNPYAGYVSALNSPAPDSVLATALDKFTFFRTAPGWVPAKLELKNGSISVSMLTKSGTVDELYEWCKANNLTMTIKAGGVIVSTSPKFDTREKPKKIYPVKQVMVLLLDRIIQVIPGYNNLNVSDAKASGPYSNTKVSIRVNKLTPQVLNMLANQLKGLPLTIESVALTNEAGSFSGTIVVYALGN